MKSTKQILVVEDDPSICELITDFLSEEGYSVTCLNSAMDALKVLSDKSFHLITLDMNLPDMDGNGFLRELSRTGRAIPVVVVSANPGMLVKTSLVKSVVPKPFDLSRLLNTIEQQLRTA